MPLPIHYEQRIAELEAEVDRQVAASTEYVNALSFARRDLSIVQQQRDELLSALEELVKEVLTRNDCRPFPKHVIPAQQLIAKVKP